MVRFFGRIFILSFLVVVIISASGGCGNSSGTSGASAADIYGPSAEGGRIRFHNGYIYTGEGDEPTRDELWVDGDTITYVGPGRGDAPEFDAEIDLGGDLLMPGFKNGHAHSPMTFLRSYADDLPLDAWLNEQVFPMEALLTSDDVYQLYRLAVLEYISGGITAAFDMYMFTEEMARAAVDTGFRAVFCAPLNSFVSSPEAMEAEYLRLNEYNDLVTYHIGFHAEYTNDEKTLEAVAALSRKYGTPVFFHSSETTSEVEGCVSRHGMTPTAYFDKLGLLDNGGGAFHCVHVTPEDIRIMVSKDVAISTNPGSNCKLASGIAPVNEMLAAGATVGIGTDGPASNNALDMFREMYLVAALQRIQHMDAAAIDAGTVLRMATEGSARVMRLDKCVKLAPEMLADCVVIDLDQPNMQPQNDMIKNLVYAGGKQNVAMTMIGGKILYEDGKYFIGDSPESIYEKANAIILRMKDGSMRSYGP